MAKNDPNFTGIFGNIFSRHRGGEEAAAQRLAAALKPKSEIDPKSWLATVATPDALLEQFPGARFTHSMGEWNPDEVVYVATRWGNRGLYTSRGYVQITLIPGEVADVSFTGHDPKTGKAVTDVFKVQKLTNVKLFESGFSDDFDTFLDYFSDELKVGQTKTKEGKVKQTYRGSELTLIFQGQNRKVGDDTWEIVPTAFVVIDTQRQTEDLVSKGLDLGFLGVTHAERKPRRAAVAETIEEIVNQVLPEAAPPVPSMVDILTGGDDTCPI